MELLDDTFQFTDKESAEYKNALLNSDKSIRKQKKRSITREKHSESFVFYTGFYHFWLNKDLSGAESLFIFIFAAMFGICAMITPSYARYSLSIGLILYLLNLVASFYEANPLMVFGLIVKGVVIYFLVVGLNAAIKLPKILEQMRSLDITPYKY